MGLSRPNINNKISKLKVKLNTTSTPDNTSCLSKLSDNSYNPEKVVKELKEHHKQLSKAEMQTILIKYNYGDSVKDIAEHFGCCTRTITKILKENNITPTKQFAQRKAVPEIVMQLYADWYRPKEIAEIFGVSTYTILQVLKKNNVYIRKAWEYPKR